MATNSNLQDSGMLERMFRLRENNTNVRTEVLAGLTTFITMAYIIFVNPSILRVAGMNGANAFGDAAAAYNAFNDPLGRSNGHA